VVLAASHKEEKYASIGSEYLFAPIAVETLGPMNASSCQLFASLGRNISSTSGNDREGAFLFQRVSVLVQRYIQRSLVTWHLASPLTARICNQLCIILIFLNFLENISTEG